MAEMTERWIVDAMNVIGSRPDGWWNDRRGAMRAFALAVEQHARATGKDMTVVFDQDPGPLAAMDHVEIVVARRAGRNAGDYEIERLVNEDADPASLRVVTSDRRLIDEVRAAGAAVVSSSRFREELDREPNGGSQAAPPHM
ncbi:MAG: NYN domain-containing protein [Actinomycetota bacterium]|nr:NYN domain-containing protein [Actinomycetota bacterium]